MMYDYLGGYKVQNVPDTVYYMPNFITEEEEQHILKNVYSVPKPKWTCLKNRQLQDYGGVPHQNGMIVEPIPSWLHHYMDKVSNLSMLGNKKPNHVLVNEYKPGQGIMPHLDGQLFHPTITTISCGSHTILEFSINENRKQRKICDLLLERRSLVIIQHQMYEKYLHSISEISTDCIGSSCVNLKLCENKYKEGDVLQRGTRVSLTIRNVPKVCKVNLFKPKS